MRKTLLPFAMMGLMAIPLVACDVQDGETDTDTTDTSTDTDTNTDTDTDTVGPTEYFAVIVDDSKIFPTHRTVGTDPCATASAPLYAHGADIDAVGLFDGATLVGYFDVVDYQEGGICTGTRANTMTDATQAKGAPDGKIDRGFVSLGGGFLTGEFDNQAKILSGYTIVVYEVGKKCGSNTSCGGVDEGYEVFVAEDLDCVNAGDGYPYSTCGIKLSDTAKGEATIPVSGF